MLQTVPVGRACVRYPTRAPPPRMPAYRRATGKNILNRFTRQEFHELECTHRAPVETADNVQRNLKMRCKPADALAYPSTMSVPAGVPGVLVQPAWCSVALMTLPAGGKRLGAVFMPLGALGHPPQGDMCHSVADAEGTRCYLPPSPTTTLGVPPDP